MTENFPDTATPGFASARWFTVQIEGVVSLLGKKFPEDVAAYASRYVREGDLTSQKFLYLELRDGRKYWFFNFKELVQVVEVTTAEQLNEQKELLQMIFG